MSCGILHATSLLWFEEFEGIHLHFFFIGKFLSLSGLEPGMTHKPSPTSNHLSQA